MPIGLKSGSITMLPIKFVFAYAFFFPHFLLFDTFDFFFPALAWLGWLYTMSWFQPLLLR